MWATAIGRALAAVAAGALITGLAGCSSNGTAAPTGPPAVTASPTLSGPTGTVPADGVTLRRLGFGHGPLDAFSLPRGVVFAATADQPNGVTLIASAPSPAHIADYLRRALPAAGFAVTRDDRSAATLTFAGHGWSGSFTATGGSSAILLRPE